MNAEELAECYAWLKNNPGAKWKYIVLDAIRSTTFYVTRVDHVSGVNQTIGATKRRNQAGAVRASRNHKPSSKKIGAVKRSTK